MKAIFTFLLLCASLTLFAQQPDTRYFELRIYYCRPGQLEPIVDRFQKYTTRIFEKNGMENIGYWLPIKNEQNALYYILAYPNKEARKKSWDAFAVDPQWKELLTHYKEKMVDSIVSVFMTPSEVHPFITAATGNSEHVYELRMYNAFPGKLPNLINRFKNHTTGLFQKHGMENIVYFVSEENEGVQSRLIYLLAYPGIKESEKSWTEFRADPDWISVRDASEKDGKLVDKVLSVYLKPLPFSKMR